jgi:tetraacyldisaccharide 4'-kinase
MPVKRDIDQRVQKIWYGDSSLRWLLSPFAWIYALVVACRRWLYAAGLLRSFSVAAPVVIVGNITVGGTGKTPLTMWLAEQLAAKGHKPCIISRGYGGDSGSDPQQVTAESDPALVGDEAILMAIRSGCPVIVHPDRVAAAKLAVELGASIILSDDGLQHYRLRRDYEIAVVDGTRRYGNRQLLPAGPLREPISRLASVNQVLVQRAAGGEAGLSFRATDKPPIDFCLVATKIYSLDKTEVRSIRDFAGVRVHALAGIGNPERFFRLLEEHKIDVIRHPLPDHAQIEPQDLEFGDQLDVVMTEKDAVKCRWLDTGNCWYVPVDVSIDDAAARDFVERIVQRTSPDNGDTMDAVTNG